MDGKTKKQREREGIYQLWLKVERGWVWVCDGVPVLERKSKEANNQPNRPACLSPSLPHIPSPLPHCRRQRQRRLRPACFLRRAHSRASIRTYTLLPTSLFALEINKSCCHFNSVHSFFAPHSHHSKPSVVVLPDLLQSKCRVSLQRQSSKIQRSLVNPPQLCQRRRQHRVRVVFSR